MADDFDIPYPLLMLPLFNAMVDSRLVRSLSPSVLRQSFNSALSLFYSRDTWLCSSPSDSINDFVLSRYQFARDVQQSAVRDSASPSVPARPPLLATPESDKVGSAVPNSGSAENPLVIQDSSPARPAISPSIRRAILARRANFRLVSVMMYRDVKKLRRRVFGVLQSTCPTASHRQASHRVVPSALNVLTRKIKKEINDAIDEYSIYIEATGLIEVD